MTDPDNPVDDLAQSGEDADDQTQAGNTERSPRRGMCAAVLSLEAIIVGLTTPVMISVVDMDASTAVPIGLGLAVACLLLAGMLRAEWAYAVGYVLQVAAIALGLLVPMMFVLGAIFGALWVGADLLGRKIERERAAAWAEWNAQQAG